MAYSINNNHFTKDLRGIRSQRLGLISKNLKQYSEELCLPSEFLDWSSIAFNDYMNKLALQSKLKDLNKQKVAELRDSLRKVYDKYKFLKNIISASYTGSSGLLSQFGIEGPIPKNQEELLFKAQQLNECNQIRVELNDPKALPGSLMDSFIEITYDSEAKLEEIKNIKEELKSVTDALRKQYAEDSQKLRIIMNWAISFWGENNHKLNEIGYATSIEQIESDYTTNQLKLLYDSQRKEFVWDNIEWAKSYQLAYSFNDKDWEIAYYGTDCKVPYSPFKGKAKFRLRAKNGNGFTQWSEPIEISPSY